MDGMARPQFQFSLADLLLLMTAVCMLLGIAGWIAHAGFLPTDSATWQMLGVFAAAFAAIGYGVYCRYK